MANETSERAGWSAEGRLLGALVIALGLLLGVLNAVPWPTRAEIAHLVRSMEQRLEHLEADSRVLRDHDAKLTEALAAILRNQQTILQRLGERERR